MMSIWHLMKIIVLQLPSPVSQTVTEMQCILLVQHRWSAAKMFQEAKIFTGFAVGCQQSVPQLLIGLARMVVDGSSKNKQVTLNTCSI